MHVKFSVWVRGSWWVGECVCDSDKMLQTSRRVRETAGEGLFLVNTRSSCFPALCVEGNWLTGRSTTWCWSTLEDWAICVISPRTRPRWCMGRVMVTAWIERNCFQQLPRSPRKSVRELIFGLCCKKSKSGVLMNTIPACFIFNKKIKLCSNGFRNRNVSVRQISLAQYKNNRSQLKLWERHTLRV